MFLRCWRTKFLHPRQTNTKTRRLKRFKNACYEKPTPISWGELYTSLQQRVVDGAENNPPSFYTSHHYEVCKHYSLDEHTAVPDVLLINTHTWNKLNEQEKNWLQEAAKQSVAEQRKIWDSFEKMALEEIQKAGVKIYYPDKKPFAEKVQKIHEEYKKDERLKSLIERIKETK